MYRRVGRRAGRPVVRSVLRSRSRSALRDAWRTVIPYDGPSLNDICALINRYIRLANAYDKKWNPPPPKSRFKPLCSPEESRRKFEEDLQRCYGKGAEERGNPASGSQRPAENIIPFDKQNASPAPAAETKISASTEKKDVVAVPLIRTASGLLGLDWSAAK